MPELPDVETVVRMLRRRVLGRRIRSLRLLTASTVRSPDPRAFTRLLRGRRIQDVNRRGKYLLLTLENDLTLVAHLRMTGDFIVTRRGEPVDPHTRVIFQLDGPDLRFTDQRRFGHMDLLRPAELSRFPALLRLGIEPLDRDFTLKRFREIVRNRRGTVKSMLLRQDLIAGIGNIYADDILWEARLHPARSTSSLGADRIARLDRVIRRVLARAVAGMSRYGRPVGKFLEARERDGICPRCGRALRISTVAGRTTYACPFCQR